jgi:diguanylate cyclase (GGDEF)-like protein
VIERRAHPPAEERDLEGLVRHVALADWLVLAVVLLHLLVAPARAATVPTAVALALFAAVSVALRVPRLTAARPALALEIETWAMAAFITVVAWFTGGAESPLQSLYLLPIVLASLVLPARRLALLLAAIAAAYLLVAGFRPGGSVAPAAFAGRVLAVLGPLLVVAWLTAQLGTAVLAGRRRAAALTEGDALTGLATRPVFLDRLRRELSYGARSSQPCGALVVDLDGARRLNEQYGDEAGNAALKLVAEALRRTLRETDLAARWGGDEFAVLLPGADRNAAHVVAQRIRHAVYTTTLQSGARLIKCSVSVGVAAAPRDGRDALALIASAERRLERDRELRRSSASTALRA